MKAPWRRLGAVLGCLRASWVRLGGVLGVSCGRLGPSWGVLGASLGCLTPFPIKKFEIRLSYLLEISPVQEMDKSLISPISPTSGLMSAPLRWNRTYHEHQDGE